MEKEANPFSESAVIWVVDYAARYQKPGGVPDVSVQQFGDLLMGAYFSLDPLFRPGRIEIELTYLGRGLCDYLICCWPELPIVGVYRGGLKLDPAHCRTFSDRS